jgi:nucleotide-binding universal stress UspA family protein
LRVADGPAAPALLALAAEESVDLVAAGRRGRSGWRERVLGGVADKLLHLAPCPVLVAH